MSSGPKFGADLLAYPGDPSLFHAQFTVRVVPPGQPICPTALKAAVRGSHAARKHLLLASDLAPLGAAACLLRVGSVHPAHHVWHCCCARHAGWS